MLAIVEIRPVLNRTLKFRLPHNAALATTYTVGYKLAPRNLFIILIALLTAYASAQEVVSQPDFCAAKTQIRQVLSGFVDHTPIPGLSAAVAVNDEIVWSRGFGFADLGKKTLVEHGTRFRVASLAKPMTGSVAALLSTKIGFDLDAPVQQYVPSFPEKRQGQITPRQLAGHLSGIRHYANNAEKVSNVHYDTLVEAIRIFSDDELTHAPGADFLYSTFGYTLLGAAMEKAAGKEFSSLMSDELFQPLGMTSTIVDTKQNAARDTTRFYVTLQPSEVFCGAGSGGSCLVVM